MVGGALIGGTLAGNVRSPTARDAKERTPMADQPQTTPEEHPTKLTTVETRQGTGPRDMVTVLVVSLLLAAVAGTAILAYFLT
jgi:hypothetical protein